RRRPVQHRRHHGGGGGGFRPHRAHPSRRLAPSPATLARRDRAATLDGFVIVAAVVTGRGSQPLRPASKAFRIRRAGSSIAAGARFSGASPNVAVITAIAAAPAAATWRALSASMPPIATGCSPASRASRNNPSGARTAAGFTFEGKTLPNAQ